MRKEFRQRIAKEYRYAATMMQQSEPLGQKLFYFSVLFGEAQRILNWEWNRDLALIHTVSQQAYGQILSTTQPQVGMLLPPPIVFDGLTQATSDLAAYFEGPKDDQKKLCQILGYVAELAYLAGGNGIYLFGKGAINPDEPST